MGTGQSSDSGRQTSSGGQRSAVPPTSTRAISSTYCPCWSVNPFVEAARQAASSRRPCRALVPSSRARSAPVIKLAGGVPGGDQSIGLGP